MGIFSKRYSKKSLGHPYCTAIVPAAGTASRMEGIDKILADLGGMPVLARTLLALEQCCRIDEIIVVTREDLIVPIGHLCRDFGVSKVRTVIQGGASRAESVQMGVRQIAPQTELVAIHDGARPLVTQTVLMDALIRGAETGAAAPAVPVKDTIKRAKHDVVQETPDRSELFAVQTPQVFHAPLIAAALQDCMEKGIPLTDDCSAVEAMGMRVSLTKGSYENIKITTPVDLATGEAILQWQQQH